MKITYIFFLIVYAQHALAQNTEPRRLEEVAAEPDSLEYYCVSGYNSTCDCGPTCLVQISNNTCANKACYKYNHDDNTCKPTGPDKTAAVVLAAIPLTGIFGSGFGNMGRWDLFSIGMGICFGPCVLICCCGILAVVCSSGEDQKLEYGKCATQCFSCLWSVAIITFYIWQLVVIVNEQVLGGDNCKLTNGNAQSGVWEKPNIVR